VSFFLREIRELCLNPVITFSWTEGTESWQLIFKLIIIIFSNLLLLLNADQFLLPGLVKWSNEPRDRCYRATNWNHTFHWQLRHMKIFSSSLARSYFYSSLHGDLCFYCFYKYFVWRAHRTPIDEFIFCQRWSQVSFFYIQSSTKSGMLGNLNTRYYKLFLLPQVLNSLF
jgi:hypothetical protein